MSRPKKYFLLTGHMMQISKMTVDVEAFFIFSVESHLLKCGEAGCCGHRIITFRTGGTLRKHTYSNTY